LKAVIRRKWGDAAPISKAITAIEGTRSLSRVNVTASNGCTQSILMAHGLAIGMLRELVRKGLATADQRSMRARLRTIEVTWLTITAQGRRVLAKR
jgi:hypothetical protein